MDRIRVPLVLLTASLLLVTCARMQPPAPGHLAAAPPVPADCRDQGKGVKNLDAPVVCVDDSQSVLKVDRHRFWIHDRLSSGASGSPKVEWYTRSGQGELLIRFKDERCVRNVVCNGGHCMAIASRLPEKSEREICKYDVVLTGHPDLDPEGVLTGCCLSAEPDN